MANPGNGVRSVWSVLCEISYHLLEPISNTTLTANVLTGSQTVTVGSTVAMFVGAELIIDPYAAVQEVVIITAVVPNTSFTAVFVYAHSSGALVFGPTFPTQAIAGDPFFTTAEMLSYLSRAQNEFLARVPCIFQLSQQELTYGQIYQTTPANCIEIDRIAVSNPDVVITSLTRTGNVVTAVMSSPHSLLAGSPFSILSTTSNPLTDTSFVGSFAVITVLSPTQFTYQQFATNSSSTGGYVGLWTRLYEVSQEELTMQDRNWQVEFQLYPRSWFEDRTGNYKFGVGGKPASNFPVELLCSIRDTDSLALTDGFEVPDMVIHYIKYKTLSYCWSKDGEQRNDAMAQYCNQRFEMGVVATQRWLDGMVNRSNQQARRRTG